MATTKDIQEKSKKLASKLSTYGMNVSEYSRSPAGGKMVFIISPSVSGDQIRLWAGERSKINVVGDKDWRQAVLQVDEEKRTIVREFKYSARSDWEAKARAERELENLFVVPGRARTSSKIIGTTKQLKTTEYLQYHVEAKLTIPRSSVNLLVGMDETAHFVAALPKRVDSVKEAHEILKPEDLPENNVVRQGEWFFEPVDNETYEKLEMLVELNPNLLGEKVMERNSTHKAKQGIYIKNDLYVIGYIIDTRKDRHDPIYLGDWHRVVRNKEISMPRTTRTRYWD